MVGYNLVQVLLDIVVLSEASSEQTIGREGRIDIMSKEGHQAVHVPHSDRGDRERDKTASMLLAGLQPFVSPYPAEFAVAVVPVTSVVTAATPVWFLLVLRCTYTRKARAYLQGLVEKKILSLAPLNSCCICCTNCRVYT